MVNLITLFRKTLSNSSNTNIHVGINFCVHVPSQKLIKKLNGNCARWPCHVLKVFDDKMIVYQHNWLKFPQPIKHLLFYFPYKNCKQSLISIDFIAPVYGIFDNLSYSRVDYLFSVEILVNFFSVENLLWFNSFLTKIMH